MVILRDGFRGVTRFEAFRHSLGVGPNMLTNRGRGLLTWGNRHFPPARVRTEIVDALTGTPANPVLADCTTGRLIDSAAFKVIRTPEPTP